jgi:hypothetical protein
MLQSTADMLSLIILSVAVNVALGKSARARARAPSIDFTCTFDQDQ